MAVDGRMEIRMNDSLLTMFRQLPCCECGVKPCHVSFILKLEHGGTEEYFNLMPLCVKHCHEHNRLGTIELSKKYVNVLRYLINKGWEMGRKLTHKDIKGAQ